MNEFALNVIASIFGGIILAFLAKVNMERILSGLKKTIPFIVISLVFSLVILGVIKGVENIKSTTEKARLQTQIDNYLKEHEKFYFDEGFTITVHKTAPKVVLFFRLPQDFPGPALSSDFHPLSTEKTEQEITKIVRKMGIKNELFWGYEVKPYDSKKLEELGLK